MNNYAGFVYEWTNTITGKKYIGGHYGVDSDRYVGSGVDFRKDLKHYGLSSFERKILEYVQDADDLPLAEKKYLEKVNARDNPLYYNKTNGSSVAKKEKHVHKRAFCTECKTNLQAVNYTDPDGITHYRKRCSSCIRRTKRVKRQAPLWFKNGYRKKPHCEKCGFVLKYPEQSVVYHVDGNLQNVNWHNLKTVCLNCQQELHHTKINWKTDSIVPDF